MFEGSFVAIVTPFKNGKVDAGALKKLIDKLGITFSEVAYVGDDVIDLPAMNKVALPIAVADAHSEVKKIAKFITENNGGQGAVREYVN